MSDPITILDFWIGTVGPEGWYKASDPVDAEITARFAETWAAARDGHLDHWVDGPPGTLAFLILCDQFSRNMFRGDAKAFATDAAARHAARRAIDAGWDLEVPEPERQFFYLPFEHSEDIADQDYAVDLFANRMTGDDADLHARVHREIIRRFGRFPYRNGALGRTTTATEAEFMQNGGYAALVKEMSS